MWLQAQTRAWVGREVGLSLLCVRESMNKKPGRAGWGQVAAVLAAIPGNEEGLRTFIRFLFDQAGSIVKSTRLDL